MVCGIGNEERHKVFHPRDDMEVDAIGRDVETNVKRFYEEPTPVPQYNEQQWSDWTTTCKATLEEARSHLKEFETEVDWLGKGGKGANGGGKGEAATGSEAGKGGNHHGHRDKDEQIVCLYCHEPGHVKKDRKKLSKFKAH